MEITAVRASEDIVFPLSLSVVSLFHHAALGADESGTVITLLSKGRLAGPWSVVVDTLPPIDVGAVVVCEREGGVARFASALPSCSLVLGDAQIRGLDRFLSKCAPPGSLYAAAATDETLCEKLRAHGRALAQGCSPLPRIDGIGIGLTPSTDDYLLGLLAVGQACNLVWVERLEASVRTVLGNLAPVSRLMLEHALDGDYPEVVVRLFERRDRSALFDFMRHGETSGFDMLCGMLGALWISTPNAMQMIGAAGSL